MTKSILRIRSYMTPSPHSIGVEQPFSAAHKMMRELRIRHLPVLEGGRLLGIVSERDLHIVETLKDVDPNVVTVEEAMTSDVHCVAPDAPLDEVAREMAEHKYGSTVVMAGATVVGIFTTVDACRALAELLHERAKS